MKDKCIANDKVRLGARINRNLPEITRVEKNIILARTMEEMDEYARFIVTSRDEMSENKTTKSLRNSGIY